MSNLPKAAEALIEEVNRQGWENAEAISDDVATIAILGTLSPGQLRDKEMQWVFSHLVGDILDAMEDNPEAEEGSELEDLLGQFAVELEEAIGTVTDKDLKDQLGMLTENQPGEDDDEEGGDEEDEGEEDGDGDEDEEE
jgi:hypothetical protein